MAICGSNFQCYNGSPLHKFSVLQWLSVAQSFIDTIALLGSKFQCYNGYPWLKISVLQWLSVAQNFSATMAIRGSKFQCCNGYPWLKISVLQWLSVVPNVSTTMALSGWICQLQWLSVAEYASYNGFPCTFSIRKLTIRHHHIHNTTAYWQTEKDS